MKTKEREHRLVVEEVDSHLTSTSPPTCITNEPSGCFTDHRKSSSFSLEEVGRRGQEGEDGVLWMEGDKAEQEQKKRVDGKWNSLTAANLIKH